MPEELKGLDAHLSAAIDEHFVDDDAPIAPSTSEPEQKESSEHKEAKDEAKADSAEERLRGPDGKFIARDQAEAGHSGKESAPAEAKPAEPGIKPDTPKEESVEPHPMWPAELKAAFAKWPRDVQIAFRERDQAKDAEHTRKSQELSEERKAVEPLLASVTKHQPFLQHIGYTPDRFVEESVAVAQRLMSGQPQFQGQAIAHLMQIHRIPPEAVLQALGVSLNPGEAIQVDPASQQTQQELFLLKQQIEGIERSRVERNRADAQAEFDRIGLTKNDDGSPKFPLWDQVKEAMINIVANGVAESWQDAYDLAILRDPEKRAALLESERQRTMQAEQKRREEAVAKAKKAQHVETSPAAPSGGRALKGLDAHLSAALDKFYQE